MASKQFESEYIKYFFLISLNFDIIRINTSLGGMGRGEGEKDSSIYNFHLHLTH